MLFLNLILCFFMEVFQNFEWKGFILIDIH